MKHDVADNGSFKIKQYSFSILYVISTSFIRHECMNAFMFFVLKFK